MTIGSIWGLFSIHVACHLSKENHLVQVYHYYCWSGSSLLVRFTPNWGWIGAPTACTAGPLLSPTTRCSSWKVLALSFQRWGSLVDVVLVQFSVVVVVVVVVVHFIFLSDLRDDRKPKQQCKLLQPSSEPWKKVNSLIIDPDHDHAFVLNPHTWSRPRRVDHHDPDENHNPNPDDHHDDQDHVQDPARQRWPISSRLSDQASPSGSCGWGRGGDHQYHLHLAVSVDDVYKTN